MRWGLVPHWAAEARIAGRTFNARAETIAVTPAFRDAFRRRRCLVPVDSFYEWRREDGIRQPYRVVAADGNPLVLAGLWAGWRDPADGSIRRTFTIVTTAANDALRDLHDRMPVILPSDAWVTYLAFDAKGVELTGQAGAASNLIPLLENSPRLERVEFASPVTRGRDREQFRIRAAWEAPAPPATPPPQAAKPPAAGETRRGESPATRPAPPRLPGAPR